jgi:hypothetical protein
MLGLHEDFTTRPERINAAFRPRYLKRLLPQKSLRIGKRRKTTWEYCAMWRELIDTSLPKNHPGESDSHWGRNSMWRFSTTAVHTSRAQDTAGAVFILNRL